MKKYVKTYPFKNPDYWMLAEGIVKIVKEGIVPLDYGRDAMKEMVPPLLKYFNENPPSPTLQKRLRRHFVEIIKE